MPEKLTEAQARRVCEALRRDPDAYKTPEPLDNGDNDWYGEHEPVKAWEIVQRAAEEE